jgi:hypothetical protein
VKNANGAGYRRQAFTLKATARQEVGGEVLKASESNAAIGAGLRVFIGHRPEW